MEEMSKLTLHDVVTVCDESQTDCKRHYRYLPKRYCLYEEVSLRSYRIV
jgi:hypothetical protein